MAQFRFATHYSQQLSAPYAGVMFMELSLKSREEITTFIAQNYNLLDKTIRKNSGNHSLKVEEFNVLGVRRVIISKAKVKGIALEFWSTEEQAEFLANKVDITQGSKSSSHGVWKYLGSLEEAKELLINVLKASAEYSEQEIEEVDDEYNRSEIEGAALSSMNNIDRAKYEGFWDVSRKLNLHLGSIFHVDHAKSIKHGRESAIAYQNLQILVKGINTSKSDSSWSRFTYEQQCSHIVNCAEIIPDSDIEYVNFLIEQLRLYWE